jgi:hypothetical protein
MPGRQVTPPGHLTFEIYRAFARRQPLQHLQVIFRENKKSGSAALFRLVDTIGVGPYLGSANISAKVVAKVWASPGHLAET